MTSPKTAVAERRAEPAPSGAAGGHRDRRRALRRYVLFLALAAAAAATLVAVGWWPTRQLVGGVGGTAALAAGCAIAWFGSAVGGLPVMLAEATGRPTLTMVLGSTALRPVAVLAVAAGVAVSGRLPIAPLLVWTALGHLVLLVVDTLYAAGATGARVPVFGRRPAEAGEGPGKRGPAAGGPPAQDPVQRHESRGRTVREDGNEGSTKRSLERR